MHPQWRLFNNNKSTNVADCLGMLTRTFFTDKCKNSHEVTIKFSWLDELSIFLGKRLCCACISCKLKTQIWYTALSSLGVKLVEPGHDVWLQFVEDNRWKLV